MFFTVTCIYIIHFDVFLLQGAYQFIWLGVGQNKQEVAYKLGLTWLSLAFSAI